MKNSCLFLSIAFLLVKTSFGQNFAWTVADNYLNLATSPVDPVIDQEGNIYVAGQCSYDGRDPNQPDTTRGFFFNKYSPQGDIIWSKLSLDYDPRIAINRNLNEIVISSIGKDGYDISKYDYDGNLKYRENIIGLNGTVPRGYIRGLSIDGENNCFLVGVLIEETINIGGFTINNGINESHFFVVKFNDENKVQWVQKSNSGHVHTHTGIRTDKSGNAYVYGNFIGNITVGEFAEKSENSNGFLAKLDGNGTFKWLINIGAKSQDLVSSATLNHDGSSIYIIGFHSNTFMLDSFVAEVRGQNEGNVFLCKISNGGKIENVKSIGASNLDVPGGIFCTSDSDIYFTAGFRQSTVISGSTFSSNSILFEPYLAKLDQALNLKWLTKTGASTSTEAYAGGVTADENSNIVFTGQFIGALDFAGQPQKANTRSMYVAKVNDKEGFYVREMSTINEHDFAIYPVPSTGDFQVRYRLNNPSRIDIQVKDESGKSIKNLSKESIKGENVVDLHLPNNCLGVHYVTLIIEGKKVAKKQLIKK